MTRNGDGSKLSPTSQMSCMGISGSAPRPQKTRRRPRTRNAVRRRRGSWDVPQGQSQGSKVAVVEATVLCDCVCTYIYMRCMFSCEWCQNLWPE